MLGKGVLRRSLLVFIIVSLLAGLGFWLAGKQSAQRMKESLQYTADNEADKFRQELERYIQATGYIESMVVAGGGAVDDFEENARMILDEYPGILELWLAPENTVEAVYPQDDGVLGIDVSALDGLPVAAESAVSSGNTILMGPRKLENMTVADDNSREDNGSSANSFMQQLIDMNSESEGLSAEDLDTGFTVSDKVLEELDGSVFVIYNPVYYDGRFWGFVNVVVSAYRVFADSGMLALEDAGCNYMIYQMNENFDLYIALNSSDEMEVPAEALFMLGGWEWSVDVALKPDHVRAAFGWPKVLASLLIGLGIALLYLFWKRHREEQAVIVSKDQEISVKSGQLEQEREANRVKSGQLEQEREANRAKTEFVSRISHDIRTPIGAILNLTEFAKRDIDDRAKLEKDLDRIDSSGKFLLSLINDVLDISKVNSGKIELNSDIVNYDSYLKSLSDLMDTMCGEKKQTFVLESDHESGLCFVADKVRLRQIALNLLSNAVKYSPEGTTVRYTSHIQEEDGHVGLTFTVSDEGIGMSEEFQQIMFDEFSQEYDNPLRDSGIQGTGLGLPIVKKLIDLMGGTLKVESERGKGTAITAQLHFPKAQPQGDGRADGMDAAGQEPIPAKILFAEDNEINAEIAARIFEEMGVSADHAADGSQAADMFSRSPMGYYDAIFMDIQMPVMNGLEATAKIRSLERIDAQAVPIIAMTADAFREAMDKAEAAGMTEYITKPLEPARIREILEKIMEGQAR